MIHPAVAPKATIAMYLCFFPVTVAMVQGLRAPQRIETVDMGVERTHVPVNRFSNFRQREFRPSDFVGKVRCGSDECVAVEELSR